MSSALRATDVAASTTMRSEPSSPIVVLRRTARQASKSGVLWGYVFGIVVASSAISYTRLYRTQSERDHLAAAFGSNRAASALFGPAPQLDTVAGFTVFKSFMTLVILGGLWGLLTSTRLIRGEEDAGRWELVLSGQTTRRGAVEQALGGLAAGAAALWAVTALLSVLAGQYSKVGISPGPMLYFAVTLVSTPVMFLAVGSFTSQLGATRRQAAAYAGWFLGACYGVRMVADAGVGLHGLVWVSPLGWVEQLRPLTSPEPLAFLPIIGFTAVVAGLAVHLAGARDVGAGTLPDRVHAPARTRLLFGQLGLTLRLTRPTVAGWTLALAATGFVLGLIAKAAGTTMAGSSVQTVFSRLGVSATGSEAFLGVTFLIVAVLVAFLAAGQVTAARAEEAQGRLDHLLVRPVTRLSWLGGRIAVGAAAVVIGALVVGLATWVGASTQGDRTSLSTLLGAGLNVVPPALCLLGIGVLAVGVWPRATSYVVYAVLTWSLLVEIVGGIGAVSHWVLDTSIFHHMAPAPAVAADWGTGAWMIVVGAACAVIGALAFRRRDLQGE
jgi:ABC-2 type transport system permease protein